MELREYLKGRTAEDVSHAVLAVAQASYRVWSGFRTERGQLSSLNPSGEHQSAMDVFANQVFLDALISSGSAAEVASEEMAEPRVGDGGLSIGMDPLDGSSNLATNNPVGSIFGLYSRRLPCSGRALVAAAYLTYGPTVTMTLSVGQGVDRFVAEPDGAGFKFTLSDSGLKIPDTPRVYGFGGRKDEWIPEVRDFVSSLEARGMKIRYCGTFVGDFNQVLGNGGVFSYPALTTRPQGKLRLLYETAPMAFITQQAGGYASDGVRPLLDVVPSRLSGTSPAYLGSEGLVRELEAAIGSKGRG